MTNREARKWLKDNGFSVEKSGKGWRVDWLQNGAENTLAAFCELGLIVDSLRLANAKADDAA